MTNLLLFGNNSGNLVLHFKSAFMNGVNVCILYGNTRDFWSSSISSEKFVFWNVFLQVERKPLLIQLQLVNNFSQQNRLTAKWLVTTSLTRNIFPWDPTSNFLSPLLQEIYLFSFLPIIFGSLLIRTVC